MGPKFVLLLLHLHLFILGYLTCPNKALILHCNFWKINNHAVGNKRAVWNRRAGGIFFSKSINVQTEIRPCRGDFFLKINKRACTSIRHTRVVKSFFYYLGVPEIQLSQSTLVYRIDVHAHLLILRKKIPPCTALF